MLIRLLGEGPDSKCPIKAGQRLSALNVTVARVRHAGRNPEQSKLASLGNLGGSAHGGDEPRFILDHVVGRHYRKNGICIGARDQ